MGIKTQIDRNTYSIEEDNHEIDVEVDLEGELICALNEIERSGNKKRLQKEQLKKYRKKILGIKESSDETK
jgi:hypothetical protein